LLSNINAYYSFRLIKKRIFFFEVPIDAILLDKEKIKLFLTDEYCNYLINILDKGNITIEKKNNIINEIKNIFIIFENKAHTSRKLHSPNSIDLLMHEFNYLQSRLLITNNTPSCFKFTVDFVNQMKIADKKQFVYEAAMNTNVVCEQQAKKLYTTGNLFSHLKNIDIFNLKLDKQNISFSLEKISKIDVFQDSILDQYQTSLDYIKYNPLSHTHEYNNHINCLLNINFKFNCTVNFSNRLKGFNSGNSIIYHHIRDDIDISYFTNLVHKTIDKKGLSEKFNDNFITINSDLNLSKSDVSNIRNRVFKVLKLYTDLFKKK